LNIDLDEIVNKLLDSESVVFLTGAGMSAESGIQTFRGAEGYWSKFNPMELASKEGFKNDPNLVWIWYQERLENVRKNNPHDGHFAISKIQKILPNVTVITQNVDGYHQKAGSRNVLELHGSIVKFKCIECQKRYDEELIANELNHCTYCDGLIRPDVVWFGEQLPYDTLSQSEYASSNCDIIFSIGTSSEVHPAAGLPLIAKQGGAVIIEVNPNETNLSKNADLTIREEAKSFIPKLLKRLEYKKREMK